VVIASGRSDYSCDDNSATPGTDVGSGGIDFPAFDDTPDLSDTAVNFDVPTDDQWAISGYSPIGGSCSPPANQPSGGPIPLGGLCNPADPLEQSRDQGGSGYITGGTGPDDAPKVGDMLSISDTDFTCAGGQVCWSKIRKDTGEETDISCQDEPIDGAYSLSLTTDEIDHYITAVGRCKDPSTPDGWGPPQKLGQTAATLPIQCTTQFTATFKLRGVVNPTCAVESIICEYDGTFYNHTTAVYNIRATVYKNGVPVHWSALSPYCGFAPIGTWKEEIGVDWIQIGNSVYNASTYGAYACTDSLIYIFTISKTQEVFTAGQTIGVAIAFGTLGAVGCTVPQVIIEDFRYTNTVSCS
jgi:hypothetical protein